MKKRLFSVLLALCIVLGLMPTIQAKAEITESSTANWYEFTAVSDMKNFTAGTENSEKHYTYYGVFDTISIDEDITLPDYTETTFFIEELVIPAGVTVIIGAHSSLTVQSITINGTLRCDGWLNIDQDLNISGMAYLNYTHLGGSLSGADKIVFANSSARFLWHHDVSSMADLKAAVASAETYSSDIFEHEVTIQDGFIINESVTIPGNMYVTDNIWDASKTVTIQQGCTLKFSDGCVASVKYHLVVEGTLVSDEYITVQSKNGGKLTIAETGSIGGTGRIIMHGDTWNQGREAFSARNGRKYYLEWWSRHSWIVKDVTGLSQLDSPTNLEWGYTAEPQYNEESGALEVKKTVLPGSLTFDAPELTQDSYQIWIYREDGNGASGSSVSPYASGTSLASIDFRDNITESGTYYAVLWSEGDFTEYYSSEPIISNAWTYVKPSAQIEKCTNLEWNGAAPTWDVPENSYGFKVVYYYAPDLSMEPIYVGEMPAKGNYETVYLNESWIQMNGAGYYYFKVKALSRDITEWCNSEWSDLSDPTYLDTDFTPTDPAPTDPEPTEPKPTEPKPTEPKPTEPKPTEPKPTEPKPTEPDPTTPPASENAFVDVLQDAYYFEPVQWAVANGITNGLSADSFGPDATCTRAQIVTFLWRACGSPAPATQTNPFTDVPAGQWYTDAVLWAVEKGITTGTSATTFSPDAGCTRGQVATFLWRSQQTPASVMPANAFADIDPNGYYYNAVLWAVENGITNGLSATAFGPDATCTRGQIVTFLHRNEGVQQYITRYTFHCEDVSWTEANEKAKALGGHLVHLNSIGEMGYLMARIYEMDYEFSNYILLGGKRDADSQEYYWRDMDGNKVGGSLNEKSGWESALWLMGEPSLGYGGEWEEAMSMGYSDKDGRWGWNDIPDNLPETLRKNDPSQLGTIVYIVEYED